MPTDGSVGAHFSIVSVQASSLNAHLVSLSPLFSFWWQLNVKPFISDGAWHGQMHPNPNPNPPVVLHCQPRPGLEYLHYSRLQTHFLTLVSNADHTHTSTAHYRGTIMALCRQGMLCNEGRSFLAPADQVAKPIPVAIVPQC